MHRLLEKTTSRGVERWEIRVEGCRCFIRWGSAGGPFQASTSTWDDDAEAVRRAERAVAEKRRNGYVETETEPRQVPDPRADVIAAHADDPAYDYTQVEGLERVFQSRSRTMVHSFASWLAVSADGTRAVEVGTRDAEPAWMSELLVWLRERLEDVLAVEPFAVWPLPPRFHPFETVGIASPFTALRRQTIPAISRSIALAFPAYACELRGDETVAEAACRIRDLPHVDLSRAPVPVRDLRFDLDGGSKARAREATRFLIYDTRELERLLTRAATAPPGSWLEVRNQRAETLRFAWSPAGIEAATSRGVIRVDDLRRMVDLFALAGQQALTREAG